MKSLTPNMKKPTKYTHDELVQRAVRWLKNSQKCGVAVPELVTVAAESPDAFGWKNGGSITMLVECKVSRSDFFADRNKIFRKHPERGLGNYRYYLTNPYLVESHEVPEGWGLIEAHQNCIRKILPAVHFDAGYPNNHHHMLMYSLLRRIEVRGLLNRALSEKWSG